MGSNVNESKKETILYRGEGAKTKIPSNLSKLAGRFYALDKEDCRYYAKDDNHIYAYKLDDNAKIKKARVSTEVGDASWNTNKYKELEELTSNFESEYWDNITVDSIQELVELGEKDDYYYEDTFEYYNVLNWMSQVVNRIELEKQGYDGIFYSEEDGVPQYQIWNNNVVEKINDYKYEKPKRLAPKKKLKDYYIVDVRTFPKVAYKVPTKFENENNAQEYFKKYVNSHEDFIGYIIDVDCLNNELELGDKIRISNNKLEEDYANNIDKDILDIDDDYEENLDESLEDFDDEVGVVYHGGIEKSLHKDFRSILWFTEDYDYALDFGENIFICNLNLKNTFIVGNTDGYIRGLIPTQFSTDFTRLANNLKVTPKELLKCNPDAKNIYSIVRTKAFKELCIKNGYDSVETEEFGHVCFGVFNLDQVDIVDTDFEDESTLETLSPMDESLTPRVREELLLEKGTDYKKQAIKIISNSGLFDEETSTKIIDGLFRQDIHAFNHAPAWLEKYLKGIARMLVEYCDGDKSKVQQFLTECPSEFEYYLTWVKQNREKIGNSLDDEFVNNLTYEQVKEKNNKIRDEIDAKSKDELSKMKFSDSSNYTLVPIDSYKQMHKLYGGHWTGDGTDKEGEYAGNGGTSWCHTNSKYTYGSWVNNGKNKFFVLQRNDWKDIPFNEKTNKEMSGKDDYGNSLIAILVNRFGELSDATLRCNHVGISGSADNQYNSYSELSKVVGFNVEEEILKHGFEEVSVGGLFEVNGGVLTKSGDDIEAYHSIAKYTIPDGTRTIGDYAFSCCSSLRNITIPNSVTSIGAYAFSSCSSLRNIEIPNSVTSIGISAFFNCSSLTSITIPNSVTSIEDGTFSCCRSLTSIEMPNSVTSIEENAFSGCSSLTSITIPNSVISIGYSAFYKCISLTSITIPDSVTSIGSYAFYGCSSLTSVTIPDSVTSIEENAFTECGPNLAVFTDNEYVKKYCDFKGIKYAPLSEYHKA